MLEKDCKQDILSFGSGREGVLESLLGWTSLRAKTLATIRPCSRYLACVSSRQHGVPLQEAAPSVSSGSRVPRRQAGSAIRPGDRCLLSAYCVPGSRHKGHMTRERRNPTQVQRPWRQGATHSDLPGDPHHGLGACPSHAASSGAGRPPAPTSRFATRVGRGGGPFLSSASVSSWENPVGPTRFIATRRKETCVYSQEDAPGGRREGCRPPQLPVCRGGTPTGAVRKVPKSGTRAGGLVITTLLPGTCRFVAKWRLEDCVVMWPKPPGGPESSPSPDGGLRGQQG